MVYHFIDIQVTCGSGSTTQTTTLEKTATPAKTTMYITSTRMSSTETKMTVSPTHQDNSTTVSDTLPMKSTEPSGDEFTSKFRICTIIICNMGSKRQSPCIVVIVESLVDRILLSKDGIVNTRFSKIYMSNAYATTKSSCRTKCIAQTNNETLE